MITALHARRVVSAINSCSTEHRSDLVQLLKWIFDTPLRESLQGNSVFDLRDDFAVDLAIVMRVIEPDGYKIERVVDSENRKILRLSW